MAEAIAITSGKGGVGKTTVSVNLSLAFRKLDNHTLLLDTDMGMANSHVLLGVNPEYTLENILNNEKTISEVIVKTDSGVELVSGGSASTDLLNLTNDIRVHIEEKKAYLKQLDDEKANEEIKDNIIDDHVITVRDTEEEGGGEFEDDELAIFDQKEFRLRAIRKFHFLMLIRVCCYFIMTSSKRGHLFGFRIPFIGQTWDGIFGMIGAGIAVWKNLPSVIKG